VEESTAAGEASSRAEEVVGPSSIDMLCMTSCGGLAGVTIGG
jgi:hypothetical protein